MGYKSLLVLPILMLTSACWGFVHDEKLTGPYHLVAVDVMEDMGISWRSPDGGIYVGDGLPDAKLVAVGHDERFLVAANHPRVCQPSDTGCLKWHEFRSDTTHYWYVVRQPDEEERHPGAANIKGPLTRDEFERERQRLGLPKFSQYFEG